MPNKRTPRISETEWEVMKVVWSRSPVTANDITATLQAADSTWHPNTVKTLITRLVKKGALTYKTEGRAYLYSPVVAERDCVTAVSESFLHRVFGGASLPLVAHFLNREKLSTGEIRELRRILNRKR
jgi:BlaI family penicillinase repressor